MGELNITRNLLVRQRTMLVNALRAHMAEFGIIAPQGLRHVELLTKEVAHEQERLPESARDPASDRGPAARHDGQGSGDRAAPDAMASTKPDQSSRSPRCPVLALWAQARSPQLSSIPSLFRSSREFAAWLGMTPRQNSSGGKERLGRTSKRGDKYIRSLLIAGAVAVLRHARNRPTRDGAWVRALMERKPTKVAAVALANKTARIVWAVMMRGMATARGRFSAAGIDMAGPHSMRG